VAYALPHEVTAASTSDVLVPSPAAVEIASYAASRDASFPAGFCPRSVIEKRSTS